MANLDSQNEQTPELLTENFAELLEESFKGEERLQGRVISGKILSIENDIVLIDVGLKSEGAVSVKEFNDHTGEAGVKVGDSIDVFVERFEGRDGSVMLSRDKARREESWTILEKAFESEERVNGVIFGRVKGGG